MAIVLNISALYISNLFITRTSIAPYGRNFRDAGHVWTICPESLLGNAATGSGTRDLLITNPASYPWLPSPYCAQCQALLTMNEIADGQGGAHTCRRLSFVWLVTPLADVYATGGHIIAATSYGRAAGPSALPILLTPTCKILIYSFVALSDSVW